MNLIWQIPLFFISLFVLTASTVQAGEFSVDATAMVKAHNKVRRAVGSPAVKWSRELEARAYKRLGLLQALGCTMRHGGPGENLFWASALQTASRTGPTGQWVRHRSLQRISEEDVVASWAEEKVWYSRKDTTCHAPAGKSCGHYTQIVWQETMEIGCGRSICHDKSQVWLCLYSPAGNIVGETPY